MAAMFITPPEPNHTRSANADWMELRALRAAACLGLKDDELSQVDGREQFSNVEAWVKATLEIPGFMESA